MNPHHSPNRRPIFYHSYKRPIFDEQS